ncbi:unnamed protein product [Leptosia nina]|uniref:Uncharacterized protein n=1 Tax=Leptosia nina TaxID=320188 RepID=A0AAV1JCN7_9NEOP
MSIDKCPEHLIRIKSDCSKSFWTAQKTCEHPEDILVGTMCGFSRCDCPDPMVLDTETGFCYDVDNCPTKHGLESKLEYIAGLVAQPILIKEASTIGSTSLLIALCSVVGFFTFITPILLHIITKKYVTEIHYDPDTSTYKATTYNFFIMPKQVEFTPDDVIVPDIPGMFTTMSAKGKNLFIEARHFNDPLHYAKIMGYDKPLDFKLGETDDSDVKK